VIDGSSFSNASAAVVSPVLSISVLEYERPTAMQFGLAVIIRLPVSVRQLGFWESAAAWAGFGFAFSAVVAQPQSASPATTAAIIRMLSTI
jgi:hypothetical protein